MNWFKRKLAQWVNDANEITIDESDRFAPRIRKSATLGGITGTTLDSDAQLTFTVYNAIGGKVVEFRRYDRRTDRSDHSVYVIGKDEDFGAKIAKISMLEVMKD